MARQRWASLLKKTFLALWAAILLFPVSIGAAMYTIGLVGIDYVSQSSRDLNFDAYIDMKSKRAPLEYAQDVFTEIMNTELPDSDLTPMDMTERVSQARISEMVFQLNMGDPSKAVKLFRMNPDYLIFGNIANFTVSHRESMGSNNIAVETDLAVKIVEAKTGKVVFVATGKGKSNTHGVSLRDTKRDKISEEGWHDALEKALLQITAKIKKAI